MDPRSTAQDVHRCDLCETAIAQSYCDFCHVNLCRPCIGEHISDEYETHKIVRFQDRKSTLIYPKCITHTPKNCEHQCKNCDNIFVCSSCTASEQHRGHIFVEVLEGYKTKKEVIENDAEKLQNLISPKYEEIALDLDNQIDNLDGGYQNLATEISKQGEQWHREIDIIINKMKTEIGEIKERHRHILQKHLEEIKQIQSLVNKTLLAMSEIKESREITPTIEYNSKLREFSKLPSQIKVTLPTFIPNLIDREQLESLFGQFTPLSSAIEESLSSINQPNTSVKKLLDEPELVATIKTGQPNIINVTCLNENKIWTSGITKEIKCFNIDGSLHQTNTPGNWPRDLAVDSDGDLLYTDDKSNTVNKIKNGHKIELIRLRAWKPNKLCVTSTGDLLVTMGSDDAAQSKVVRYSGSTEKQTIQFHDESKPLYSENHNMKYITENRNHDICVADCEAGAVVVVNKNGKLRWRYTGNPSVTKKKPFEPYGITTDSQSRILTVDGNNHCIHILDQDGQFLRYIDNCNLEDPFGLCVDNNDNLFVCECHKGNVKKIKY
ncbi:E3 ubiquitin-protein ligase Midline-1-like isoform X2 [Magallana gigas]|uniref:E3 ubiquitin-protein ligase Midline-1-like isoform X2 n=1 Tax=Magallana gigas TaxID=29159 RepID=UPI0033412C0D